MSKPMVIENESTASLDAWIACYGSIFRKNPGMWLRGQLVTLDELQRHPDIAAAVKLQPVAGGFFQIVKRGKPLDALVA